MILSVVPYERKNIIFHEKNVNINKSSGTQVHFYTQYYELYI